jgi:hypothetical protein
MREVEKPILGHSHLVQLLAQDLPRRVVLHEVGPEVVGAGEGLRNFRPRVRQDERQHLAGARLLQKVHHVGLG